MDKKMVLMTQVRAEDYCYCKEEYEESVPTFIEEAIAEGVVLNHLTNGEVIQKMFPNYTIFLTGNFVLIVDKNDKTVGSFDLDWWNSKWEATYEANN